MKSRRPMGRHVKSFWTGEEESMATVYLAGPIEHTDSEHQRWRDSARRAFDMAGISVIDPLDTDPRATDEALHDPRSILVRDHFHVMKCDLLLANLTFARVVSIGTVMEIAWAYQAHTPIVLAMPSGNIHHHPMIDSAAALILPGIDEAIDCACRILRHHH